MSAVFSLPTTTRTPNGVVSTMDGFLNQTGRLPTKKDKITFESRARGRCKIYEHNEVTKYKGFSGFHVTIRVQQIKKQLIKT
ncbi:MAG: hypothetical protein IPH11_12945 [Ignavibacteriales bacterium]|nr:hypothetical protein [Ignavibacteriales bacterium]